jgi:hypothetical protein
MPPTAARKRTSFDVGFCATSTDFAAQHDVRSSPNGDRTRGISSGGQNEGQSSSALPMRLDVDLLCDGDRIVHFDTQVSHSALDLGVTKEELHRPEIAGATVDQRSLGSPQ